jgi:hypothetical protein
MAPLQATEEEMRVLLREMDRHKAAAMQFARTLALA